MSHMGLGPDERDSYPPHETDWLMMAAGFLFMAFCIVSAVVIWLNMY